ncbi:MAG: hypothetical protein C0501_01805 [Isosphaera sp.]|nr:hypothetical protein [Isosphaera sp.]
MTARSRLVALAGLALATAAAAQPPRPYAPAAARPGAPAAYPIDLPTALRLADANNPTVGVARARVREATAQLDRAKVAWVPSLTAGGTFFYHEGIDQNRRGDTFVVDRGNATLGAGPALRVDLADALYLPLVARQALRGANAQAAATANAVQLDVAVAYLDLVELHGLRAVNADILDRTEQVLAAAEAGAKAGLNKTAADVNRAAAEVNLRREEGIVLRGRAAAASARLARMLLLDPVVELLPHEPAVVPLVVVPGETTLEELTQTALRARPEVAAAAAGVAGADALVRQSRMAPLLPRVQAEFVGGGLTGFRDSPDRQSSPLVSQYNAGVALTWNLESLGLGTAAVVRTRRAGLDAAVLRLREAEALVAAQVVEAAETAAARFDALGAAQEAVRQAEEMYRKFRAASFGMVGPRAQFDALEPLTAVQALNAARVQYLQQVVEFNRAQFRLHAAIGQPALGGLDGAVRQPVDVPAVPGPGRAPGP